MPNVSLAPVIRQQFFAIDGTPLAGGKLYSYIAGSTTPTPTYKDASGTTQNTNAIVLDARGECDLWLDVTIAYKFKLYDSTGAFIWSEDNITASSGGGSGGTVSWNNITGKPSTFTPSAHTQAWSTITSTPTTLGGYGITDAYTKTQMDAIDAAIIAQIPSTSAINAHLSVIDSEISTINSHISSMSAVDISLQSQINNQTSAINTLSNSVANNTNSINTLNSNVSTISGNVNQLLTNEYKVKTTSADSSADYLANKIASGNAGVVVGTSANEVIISTTGFIPSDASDTNSSDWGTLFDKLIPGANMTANVVTCAGTRKMQLNAITSGIAPVVGDHKVMASLTDPSYGTLSEKLIDINGNAFGVVTCAGVQKVQIPAGDHKVSVTSATTADYLGNVLQAGSGVQLNAVGNTLSIAASGSGKVAINNSDTTPDYLINKLRAGTNVTLTPSANEITIDVNVGGAQPNAFAARSGLTSSGMIVWPYYGLEFGTFDNPTGNSTQAIVTSGKWQVEFTGLVYHTFNNGTNNSWNVSWNGSVPNNTYMTSAHQRNWSTVNFGSVTSGNPNIPDGGDKVNVSTNGFYQINVETNIDTTNPTANFSVYVYHYNSSNTLIEEFGQQYCNTLNTNKWLVETIAHVVSANAGDYFKVDVESGAVVDYCAIQFTGGLINQNLDEADASVSLIQFDSLNNVKTVKNTQVTFGNAQTTFYQPLNYSHVFDCAAGDKFELQCTLNNTSLSQMEIAGHSTGVSMGGISIVTTDSTLSGNGTSIAPLGLAVAPFTKTSADTLYAPISGTNTSAFVHLSGYDQMTGPLVTPYVELNPQALVSASIPGVIETDGNFFYINVTSGGTSSGGSGGGSTIKYDSIATFPIALGSGTIGGFDGAYGICVGVYVPYTTTVDQMAAICTQVAGNGSTYFAVYDSSFNILAQTSAWQPSAIGVQLHQLLSPVTLSRNKLYYFFIGGSSNGCSFLGTTGMYSFASPFLNLINDNITAPPSVMSGSYNGDRIFLIASNSSLV